jgi:hypothetical protein
MQDKPKISDFPVTTSSLKHHQSQNKSHIHHSVIDEYTHSTAIQLFTISNTFTRQPLFINHAIPRRRLESPIPKAHQVQRGARSYKGSPCGKFLSRIACFS